MIKASVTVEDKDLGMKALIRKLESAPDKAVDIGIQSSEDQKLVVIAAANEFGARINHPGGTPYGYASPDAAKKRKVQFLKAGSGYKVLGITKPHLIVIPARPYIRSTMDENEGLYFKTAEGLMGQMIDSDMTIDDGLAIMGQMIERDIKRKIITLKTPPNASSTIRKKGSENPLVNTGLLGGSIRFKVKDVSG